MNFIAVLFCGFIFYLTAFHSTINADASTDASPSKSFTDDSPPPRPKSVLKHRSKFDKGPRDIRILGPGEVQERFANAKLGNHHIKWDLNVMEGSHRKKSEYRKKNVAHSSSSLKSKYPYSNLGWTHTSFANSIYKNEISWGTERNQLLSPVALEVSLAAFCTEAAVTEVLRRVATRLLRIQVLVPRFWLLQWLFPPAKRFRVTRKYIRSHYSKILKSLSFDSVNVVSNLYLGEGLHLDSDKTLQLEKYFRTQVNTMPRKIKFDGKTIPVFPPALQNMYDPKLIILASALRFKGTWEIKFNPELTREAYFKGEKLNKIVKFIENTDKYYYVNNQQESYKVLELRFVKQDGPMSFLIFLPYGTNSLTDLENHLFRENWLQNLDLTKTPDTVVYVSIPKFSIRDIWNFKSFLMEGAEVDLKDLRGINQNVFLQIDESGATSYYTLESKRTKNDTPHLNAGATVKSVPATSALHSSVSFIADRPFMFALIHRLKKIILLQGHVVLP